mmetsp:Transcript_12262/g.37013  ORF Transcript_12262/g.37013 Transcript_12262/m.37013 type:complete len:257 (-) Transcript_12262:367-1137(-)
MVSTSFSRGAVEFHERRGPRSRREQWCRLLVVVRPEQHVEENVCDFDESQAATRASTCAELSESGRASAPSRHRRSRRVVQSGALGRWDRVGLLEHEGSRVLAAARRGLARFVRVPLDCVDAGRRPSQGRPRQAHRGARPRDARAQRLQTSRLPRAYCERRSRGSLARLDPRGRRPPPPVLPHSRRPRLGRQRLRARTPHAQGQQPQDPHGLRAQLGPPQLPHHRQSHLAHVQVQSRLAQEQAQRNGGRIHGRLAL